MEVNGDIKKENEELKKSIAELLQRVEFLQKPFDFENSIVIELEVEDIENNIPSAKVARINGYEFINGFMYHSLISRHFGEISESMKLKMIANRMAVSIEEEIAKETASKNMIDSLADWNNIVLNK
jgi:hypothetical protein